VSFPNCPPPCCHHHHYLFYLLFIPSLRERLIALALQEFAGMGGIFDWRDPEEFLGRFLLAFSGFFSVQTFSVRFMM
jgi:hypothetical protein